VRIEGEAKSKITGQALRGVRVTGSIDGHTKFEAVSNDQGQFQYQDQRSAAGQRMRLRAERDDYQVDEQDHVLLAGDLAVVIEMTPARDDRSAGATMIAGLVRDTTSKQLLQGAQVQAAVGDNEIFVEATNRLGEFCYEDRDGKYVGHTVTISAARASYKTQRLQKQLPAAGLVLDIGLEPVLPPQKSASRPSRTTVLITLGGLLMLALIVFAMYGAPGENGPARCSEESQSAFLNQSPPLAGVVAEGERCLGRIRDFGEDRHELLDAATEYFRYAKKKGYPLGALRHGELYDPDEISPKRLLQQPPCLREAFEDYQLARRLGNDAAASRLEAMRPYVEERAREGNEDALSILAAWPQ
jgi:hypothetical protein